MSVCCWWKMWFVVDIRIVRHLESMRALDITLVIKGDPKLVVGSFKDRIYI